jgi:predicted nucleotidyltransferase component of viral defense system
MIPQAFITEWQAFAPWATEAQVEQDLVLSRVLVAIYSHPLLENSLAFRGGTALHKLFIQPSARYSEDIDLVQINGGPIGPILEALRTQLNHWLGQPRWKTNQGRATLVYRFDSEISPVTSMRVKIEINTREHFTTLGFIKKSFELSSRWFSQKVVVTTFHLEELLATKLRALYQRKKGRDLFDLILVLKKHPDFDIEKMLHSFAQYMAFDQTKVTRAEFELNLAAKLKDNAFTNDILPLLPPTENRSYNPLDEFYSVQEKILNLLPGESWKGLNE